jgi:hypothetical protein
MATADPEKPPSRIELYGGYEVYDENGIDLTLLRWNLGRSAEERARAGQQALALTAALRMGRSSAGAAFPQIFWRLAAGAVDFVIVGTWATAVHGAREFRQTPEVCYRSSVLALGLTREGGSCRKRPPS